MKGGISKESGRFLLGLARKTIEERLKGSESSVTPSEPWLQEAGATFVTLKIDGRLRGCIGNLEPVFSLWDGVRHNALSAAFHDQRFSPLTLGELQKVQIDLSVLTKPQQLEYTDHQDLATKLRPHIDGVILRDGTRGATYLPQVWAQLPKVDQFLSSLCVKAGLEGTAWQKKILDIQTYQVQSFKEEQT